MNKTLGVIALFLLSACTEDKKIEQVIIPKAQLQALQKAKNVEAQLLEAQQKQQDEFKAQGL